MESDDPINPSQFLITGRVWFLCPADAFPEDVRDLEYEVAVKMTDHGFQPVMFTDNDLAHRYISTIQCEGKLKLFSFTGPDVFHEFLMRLEAIGKTHVVIDPGVNDGLPTSIREFTRGR